MSEASDTDPKYLEQLTEAELRSLPAGLLFFLRDLNGWLALESDPTAEAASREIRDMLEKHHDLLILDQAKRR